MGWEIVSLGQVACVSETLLDVHDVSDAVFVLASASQLLPAPVDLIGDNCLAIWPDLMLGAEIQELLGVVNTSYIGCSN